MITSKSIQELYEEVKDFDLVLTSDFSLASALNRQIKNAMVGRMAYTPKEFANDHSLDAIDHKILDKERIVLTISKKLSLSIKSVHGAVEKIIDIEKHADDVASYLSNDEKEIYSHYRELPTLSKFVSRFNKDRFPSKIAVIEPNFFNKLDKKLLPEKFTKVRLLADQRKTFDDFYLFNSQDALVDTLASLISEENQSDIGIVLDSKSGLFSLIKSRLYEKKLKICAAEFLHEDLSVRTFADLLQAAFYFEELTVKEVRPFLENFGIQISPKHGNYSFKRYAEEMSNDERLKRLCGFLSDIDNKTYKEYYGLFYELPEQLKHVIKKLDLHDEKINYDNFSDLKYFIDNFNVEIDKVKTGVLLTDCKSSIVVDRPVCFYLNPDFSWNRQASAEEYVDKKAEEEKNLKRFQIILSQGDRQLYFAQTIKNNEKNVPCFYFNQIEKRKIEDFNDAMFNATTCSNGKPKAKEDGKPVNDKNYSLEFFSQSSLNKFFVCPKQFELSRISPSEDLSHFLKGDLFHNFAEFYISHKDFCNEKEADFFADLLLKQYSKIIPKANSDVEKTWFKIGVKNIKAFIDGIEIRKDHNLPRVDEPKTAEKKQKNAIAKALNKPVNSNNAELYFENKNTKLKGIIDLVINSTSIVDYKSSKKSKTTGKIIKESNFNLITDKADFQPLVYLLELSKHSPNKELSFFYCFFMSNYGNVINQIGNTSENIVEVKYYPMTFNEFIQSEKGMETICEKGIRKDILKLLSKEAISSALKDHPLEDTFKLQIESEAHKALEQKIPTTKKSSKKAIEDFFKEIHRLRTGSSKHPKALFFKEDLEEFERFAKKQHEKANKYSKEGFPIKPISKETCKSCDFRNMCFVGDA